MSIRSERGFTLVELMVASTITLVVMGVAFTAFKDALRINESTLQLADAGQNLRAGTNLLVRDLMQAGRNLANGGIPIPDGVGATPVKRPGPTGSAYTFAASNGTLTSIVTGNGLGPLVNGQPTDLVTVLMNDPYLTTQVGQQVDLMLSPSTAPGNVAKLAADGSSLSVGPHATWLSGNAADGVAPIQKGDLLYFVSSTGSTLQTVTRVDGANVYFDANDPFNLNQRGATSGSITQMLPGFSGATMAVHRVLMYTYFVEEDGADVPRLMRAVNMFPPQALAGVIEDLTMTYDLVDGDTNPTAVPELPFTVGGLTYSANQIRKVNLHVGVRSEIKSERTKDYLRNHVSTTVSIRNLAYTDRYQ